MKNLTDKLTKTDGCGSLPPATGSAPSYAEVLKALDDLHIVCECATNPEVDEWYRGNIFAKEARANAIAILCRVRNPAKLQPEETEVEVRARVIYAKNGNVRFWEILPNASDQIREE